MNEMQTIRLTDDQCIELIEALSFLKTQLNLKPKLRDEYPAVDPEQDINELLNAVTQQYDVMARFLERRAARTC